MSAATLDNSLPVKDPDYSARPVRGPKSPLELTEILPIIASFLTKDKDALQACCRVSSTFHYVFTPVLWRDLVLPHGPQRRQALIETVRKQASLVCTLTFTDKVSTDYCYLLYPNLRHLVIQSDSDSAISMSMSYEQPLALTSLVQSHVHLIQSLKVHCPCLKLYPQFWEAVVKIRDLQHLDMNHVRFQAQGGATTFYDLGKNAKTISLKKITVTSRAVPFLSSSLCPSLWQDVHFERIACYPPMFYCLIQRIAQSSELRSLVLREIVNCSSRVNFSLETLVEEVEQRRTCWPWLVRIHLQDCDLDDRLLEVLLNALDICRIEDLNLAGTRFGPKAHVALIFNHSWTLRHLDVQRCKDVTSLMLHSILCSHARLVSIKGGKLLATDLLEDEREWVCNDLQVWKLEVCMDERDPDHCCQVFLRLSSLFHLRTLALCRGGSSRSKKENFPLPLQVDLGLELLRPLSQLEELEFDQREVLEEDWNWILESFGRLRKIVAPKDKKDEQRQVFLKRLVLSHERIAFSFF